MAGAGSRFSAAGFTDPKPLISIHGIPMIKLVVDNLTPNTAHRFIFICQKSHDQKYGLTQKLAKWAPGSSVILIDGITDGAARTVLKAKSLIDTSQPLMIANSDQFIDFDVNLYLASALEEDIDGMIMTMTATDPKWSFISKNSEENVTQVVEKVPISNIATVGIYNFRRGSDFVSAASEMIEAEDKSNGEYYVAPVYNYLIKSGKKVRDFSIGTEAEGFFGLGTPSDLEIFLKNPISYKSTLAL